MLSIPTSAKNPDEAYKFIRFYTTEGAYIRAGGLTAEKKADLKTILPKIVGNTPDKLYDMNALYSVLQNPKFVHNTPMTAPAYNAQIDSMFVSEAEKYLVGGESLDQCITNMQKQGNDIVQKAK
jgi:multiple sugar transport system substrate-binding protein